MKKLKREVSIFITTNYDTFLNKVDPQCDSYDIDGLKDQANANFFSRSEKRKRVLYLHGHVNKESSIIITKKAVEEIYRNEKWISVFQGLLNNYHILFLGVSFSDEYLRKFLSKNVENTKNSYFVITSENVEKYIEDLGGTVYFYSCNEEDFHGKEYQAVFKNDIQVLMQCKIGEESRRGYIVNQIGLGFPDTETDEDKEMFKKFQTARWKEMGKEYTFYKDESIHGCACRWAYASWGRFYSGIGTAFSGRL